MPYSTPLPEERAARAYGKDMRTSWKNSINIARAIKGMKVRTAEAYLEDVAALKKAVPFSVHRGKVAHKRGIGPGRYPKKSAQRILKVLRNANNNAEYQNLDPDNMVITHVAAYKGRTFEGFQPRAYGRATAKNEDTTNFEIFIQEVDEEES
jgi:large subunit ribosomal protein L22